MRVKSFITILLASSSALSPAAAFAQASEQPTDAATDESEIIVTAAKRTQTLQDVPISVAVVGAEAVEKAHITDLRDLQTLVPSLRVAQAQLSGATNFIIRGFGNGADNDGIEGSVGVFIDGVYRSRSAAALDDLPEIERVEVLRGPQSTLFGKNVSAGAVNITTKRPSFDWGGKAEVTVGNYGLINPRATITGPIAQGVAFRLSGSTNQRDGYFTNVTTGRDVSERNRWSVRGDLLIEASPDVSIRLIGDYNKINESCCGITSALVGPAGSVLQALGFNVGDPARRFEYEVVPDFNSRNKIIGRGLSGQIDWDLGPAKLTSITAYRHQSVAAAGDVEASSADLAYLTNANSIKTFTQEIRLASDGTGPLNWLVGGFYSNERLDTGRDIFMGRDMRTFIDALSGGLVTGLEALQNAVNPAIVPGATYFMPGRVISDNYRMKQDSVSIFGQVDYEIGRLTLTAGGAYLNDRKKAASDVVLSDRFSMLNLENVPELGFIPFAALPAGLAGCLLQKGYNPAANGGTIPVNLFGASLGASLPGAGSAPCPASRAGTNPFALNALQFFYGDTPNHGPVNYPNANESGILKGDKFTYALRAAYDFGPVNAYVSYSTGWKAGAYNLSSDSRPPNVAGIRRTADPETVEVIEAGLKARFPGGYFNLAAFKQTIKGFQSNAFNGLTFSLVNAGQQSTKGFEIDAAFKPVPWLSLTGALTYLDPRYDSFTRAPCVEFDTVRCPVNPATGLRPPFRDLSGERPAGIPSWSGAASATISHEFDNGWGAALYGEYQYVSATNLGQAVPPTLAIKDVNLFNASFSVMNSQSQLGVMLWARNLTNAHFPTAVFPATLQAGSYSIFPSQPRTYGVTLRKSF